MADAEYLKKLVAAADFVLARDRAAAATLDPAEFGVSATLKPHQIEGASWLVRRYLLGANVVLGDEMGLGKTLQAISYLNYLKRKLQSPGPFLILCPLSVTDGWSSEIAKFCPTLKVFKYVGNKEFRCSLRRTLYEHMQGHPPSSDEQLRLPFDVLLTTYDIVLLDQDFLSQIRWQICIVDEAQRLKNPSSVLYNVLEQRFIMPWRLLMTGTPIQNNLSELWSLMHFCLPTIFGTLEQFLSTFKGVEISLNDYEAKDARGQLRILKYTLKAFMLRRTKNMLIESGALVLPRLTEMAVLIPLTPLQRKVYVSILRKELQKLLAFSSGAYSHQSLQNIVIQLRKTCSHPYLFHGIEPEPFEEGEHLVQASGKLIFLDLLLQRLKASGHRVLLFAQMTHTLDILQDFLELRNYTYERLDGSVRAEERFAAIRSFSSEATLTKSNFENLCSAFVFMISTRAGGVGLNLVAADTVIFYEQDWNPQVDKQALQRAHRIGQINNVLAINLITENTVEEIIMRRAEKKLLLSNEVVGETLDLNKGEKVEPEASDLQSVIFGLRFFDPSDIIDNSAGSLNITEMNEVADKVLEMRYHELAMKDDKKVEVILADFFKKGDLSIEKCPTYIGLDPEVEESAYQSWIKKLKETSQSTDISMKELRRRSAPLDEQQKLEKERKAMEKRLAKWEALGYNSLAVSAPIGEIDADDLSDSGHVQFVYGDCTRPSTILQSEPAIIFSCVDNSGSWGRGGMFSALSCLSDVIPNAYHRAAEFKDLHIGDLHLIKINGCSDGEDVMEGIPLWVALAVVQSYNSRRNIPRSNISLDALEECLLKASFVAAQNSASLHMPRIGYQDGSQRSEWYTIEHLLRKYSSMYGVKIFVYYFRRPTQDQESNG